MAVPIVSQPLDPSQRRYVEVVLHGALSLADGSQRHDLNIMHFRQTEGSADFSRSIFLTSLTGLFVPSLLAAMPDTYTLVSAGARVLDIYTDEEQLLAIEGVGAVTSDRTTAFNAVFMRMLTGNRGRHWTGKKHFGPIPESHTTSDNLNATGGPAWDAVASGLTAAISFTDTDSISWSMIVLSPSLSILGDEPARTISYAYVTSIARSNIVGTMRHRKERQNVVF
jgi:hypothetical protein